MEAELALLESLLERVDELATKDLRQHFLREEVGISGANPAGVIGGQSAGGSDTMNMGMKSELLTPGMQDTEEADFCTEVFRVAGHFEKGFRTSAKQKIVDELLVLQDQWRQTTGQCEHNMGVARGEKFSPPGSDPLFPSGGLTLRAVAVAAANGVLSISCLMGSIFYWRVGPAWFVVLAA